MALNVDENLNSLSGIFKDTIKMSQAKLNEHVFALDLLDDIKECSDDHLSFFLILQKLQNIKIKLKVDLQL